MKMKEEYLKLLDMAYQRIVISSDEYETESFANILNGKTEENRRAYIEEFIKTYRGNSLFINYKSLLSYYDSKQIMRIILKDMEDTETDYYLYLCAPGDEVEALKEEFEFVYSYCRDWYECICDSFEDDGYVIEIRDNRYSGFSVNNFLKIYPNGQGILVTDSDYHIEKTNIPISDDIRKELVSVVKKRVKKEVKEKYKFVIDDREFLKSFVVTYGFKWLGYQCEWGMDNQDYFLKKYPSEIIGKVMNIPIVKSRFVDVSIPANAKERFEDDI